MEEINYDEIQEDTTSMEEKLEDLVEGDSIKCPDCGKVGCMCYEDAVEQAREETITTNIFS